GERRKPIHRAGSENLFDALSGEFNRNSAPDTGTGTSNDGNFAAKRLWHGRFCVRGSGFEVRLALRSLGVVGRSAFGVRRSAFGVRRSAFGPTLGTAPLLQTNFNFFLNRRVLCTSVVNLCSASSLASALRLWWNV